MATAWVDPWVGLGRVGSRIFYIEWVGSTLVEYDSLPKSTALVNISYCNHEYYRSLLYLESVHHNVFVALFVLKARRDPFADMRAGNLNPSNEYQPTNHNIPSTHSHTPSVSTIYSKSECHRNFKFIGYGT